MAKKNDSDQENLNGKEDEGFEGLLGDFSDLLGDDEKGSEEPQIDHDAMALSEILGDKVPQNDREKNPLEVETVDENEDYASFLKDFGETENKETSEPEEVVETVDEKVAPSDEESLDIDLDFSALTQQDEEENPELSSDHNAVTMVPGMKIEPDVVLSEEETSDREEIPQVAEEKFVEPEMVIETSGADTGYASILGELGDETESSDTGEQQEGDALTIEDEVSEEISFVGLETDEESASGQDEAAVAAGGGDGEGTGDDSGLMELDLGLEDTDLASSTTDEEPAITIPSAEEEEEKDFLGLEDSGGAKQEKADFLDVDAGASAEVIFAGVEMDFDEQAEMVTRAELLLAQKKKGEAAKLYKEVAEKKGKTFWVEKRLQQLS